jgi:hypothetical protein
MGIDDADSGEQLEGFRNRIAQRLAALGDPAGFSYGESFKIMRRL